MKIKRHISKLLFCSILFSNMPFNVNAASNSNLSRYETLEGEVIDLGDIKSEDITEIEIFGNTVQNPDNLEDIQSVGDLHVDKEGEPILDSQGREQYKIEIESCNESIVGGEFIEGNLTIPISIKQNSIIYYSSENSFRFYLNYKDGSNTINSTPILQSNGRYGRSMPVTKDVVSITSKGDGEYVAIKLNNDYSYTPHKSNKTTILLPCQLMKIGDLEDKLYWDNIKGKYIVEKNIQRFELSKHGEGFWKGGKIAPHQDINSYTGFDIFIKEAVQTPSTWLSTSDKVKPKGVYYGYTLIALHPNYEDGTKATYQEIVNTIESIKPTIYVCLKNAQLIETNITKKIKLTTYPEKTYVTATNNNGLKPTLKIKIDKIEEVSQEAVDNVLSNPTSSNIALARMFVNMLPDSLYKDQLQAQLNEIFSEDMVLEKQSATANLDVYIKSENILMMSLDTNTVTFEDYSGVEELELQNAINISINSSLPYQLNAYIVGDITNKDKDKTLDLDVLNIKDGSNSEYKQFDSINSKLVLLDNVEKGNKISHNIDLKLSGNKAHDADVYKTTIKFEAEQK